MSTVQQVFHKTLLLVNTASSPGDITHTAQMHATARDVCCSMVGVSIPVDSAKMATLIKIWFGGRLVLSQGTTY